MAISDRGIDSMHPIKQKQIASEGGQAAHAKGAAHQWTSDEAKAAGRKGARARAQRTKTRQLGSATAEPSESGIKQNAV
jgi:hypothetical protein